MNKAIKVVPSYFCGGVYYVAKRKAKEHIHHVTSYCFMCYTLNCYNVTVAGGYANVVALQECPCCLLSSVHTL